VNVQQDLLVSENNSNDHFLKIAPNYKELRTTDIDHIEYIKKLLDEKLKINIIDVSCGDGCYSLEIVK